MTGSMQRAIDETDRRRETQVAYNKTHGITPKGIIKSIQDVMEGGYAANTADRRYAKVAEKQAKYEVLTEKQLAKKIAQLEKQMYQHAKNLEFEQAAKVRDELQALQHGVMGIE